MTCLTPSRRSVHYVTPFDEAIRQFFGDASSAYDGKVAPVDIESDEKNIYVVLEAPGVNREDISIQYQDRVLTISGEKKSAVSDEKNGVHLSEIRHGKFSRSVRVGEVDFEKAEAKLDKGQLKITLPKSQDLQAKKLDIR